MWAADDWSSPSSITKNGLILHQQQSRTAFDELDWGLSDVATVRHVGWSAGDALKLRTASWLKSSLIGTYTWVNARVCVCPRPWQPDNVKIKSDGSGTAEKDSRRSPGMFVSKVKKHVTAMSYLVVYFFTAWPHNRYDVHFLCFFMAQSLYWEVLLQHCQASSHTKMLHYFSVRHSESSKGEEEKGEALPRTLPVPAQNHFWVFSLLVDIAGLKVASPLILFGFFCLLYGCSLLCRNAWAVLSLFERFRLKWMDTMFTGASWNSFFLFFLYLCLLLCSIHSFPNLLKLRVTGLLDHFY